MKDLAWLAIIGLQLSGASAQAPRTRDSAGVRIIENGPRLGAPVVFQLADKPSFDAGGLQSDPNDELSTRNGYPRAIRLSNGNVVVLDNTRALFYSPSGKRIAVAGRQGHGPGEFDQTTNVCATRGDTVLVGQNRAPLTRFTKDGQFISATALPTGMIAEGAMCFADGTHVLMSRVTVTVGSPSVYRFTRVGLAGPLNTITEHQYPLFDMLVSVHNPKVAVGDRMYFMNGDRFEIVAFDLNGKLAQIIRTSDPLVPLTDADKEKMPLLAYRAGSTPAEMEDARRRAIANSKTRVWPTVGEMHVDLAGRIWLEDWHTSSDPTKPVGWTAFDATGKLLGRLIIPGAPSAQARRLVVSFGKDEVIVFRHDDDGAAHYTAYPILPIRK